MQAENFISPSTYARFRRTQNAFVRAEGLCTDANQREEFDKSYLGFAPRVIDFSLGDPMQQILHLSALGAEIYGDTRKVEASCLDMVLRRERRLQAIAQDLVSHSWDQLNPLERRIVDVSAAGRRKVGIHQIRNAAVDLVDAFHFESRLCESNYGTYRSFVNDKPIFSGGVMNLGVLDEIGEDVFSSTTGDWVDDLGSNVFGVQRAMKMLMPHLVIPFLSRIPDKNTINKTDVDIYSQFVVGAGRARVYDSQVSHWSYKTMF